MRYHEQDALGNVLGTHEGTSVAQTIDYDAWGSPSVSGSEDSRLMWKGLLWEGDVVGLYYMRGRWYDPELGRFIQEDAIGLAGGINLYAFAHNDPINGSDPTGHDCFTIDVPGTRVSDGYHVWYTDGYMQTVCVSGGGSGGGGSGGGSFGGGTGGGGTGSTAGPVQPKPTHHTKCAAQQAETQVSGGASALLGGPFISAFFGVGVTGGVTSSGHVFIQLQGSVTVGAGAFIGAGVGIGGGRATVTSAGLSTGSEWLGQANAGLFESAGASVTRDDAGNWGAGASPFVHVGAGFGAQISGGRLGYASLATPSFAFIRHLFGNYCQ